MFWVRVKKTQFQDRNQWMIFEPQSQFETLCRNYVLLYVRCTIRVEYKVSAVHFFTHFSHHKSRYRCVLAPPSIHILLIVALSDPHKPCTPSIIMAPMAHGRFCSGCRYSSSSSGPASVTLYHINCWVLVFHPRTADTRSLDSFPLLC